MLSEKSTEGGLRLLKSASESKGGVGSPWPQSTFCYVTSNGKSLGTAWFVSDRSLVVAAHVFRHVSSVTIAIGWDGSTAIEEHDSIDKIIHPQFPENELRDMALIHIEKPAGRSTGKLGCRAVSDNELSDQDKWWRVYGYPGGTRRRSRGPVERYSRFGIKLAIATAQGYSGAAVWSRNEGADARSIGVHIWRSDLPFTTARFRPRDIDWIRGKLQN